ncbi:response regulator transcription factor [Schlegelella sp. S2-27]|uniref:Response regulator transcription factor n=1 Tax=Caldimonas mangrovi TaxID=2944811 RepID=A0ABT0YRY9_9BURK|nr:response regulator transcription factor [Caldimonas mangrovi]MCM5681517.1 response regulator transcription factor [Caldimonas mangrovi]
MSSAPNTTQPGPSRVAALFINRWTEASVSGALETEGMRMRRLRTAAELVSALHTADFDIAIIEDSGSHLAGCLAALRFRGTTTVPIIAVGNGSAAEIASALRLGVADYAVIGEANNTLVNRIRARVEVCRQPEQRASQHVGPCTLDAESRTLRYRGGELQLTWREFALAWVLFESPGQVVHLHTISRQVWGTDISVAKRTIEQHVCRLRRKLLLACESADQMLVLHAVTNVGYRMVAEARTTSRRLHVALPAVGLTAAPVVSAVEP